MNEFDYRCPRCKHNEGLYIVSEAGAHYIRCSICGYESESYESEIVCLNRVFGNLEVKE